MSDTLNNNNPFENHPNIMKNTEFIEQALKKFYPELLNILNNPNKLITIKLQESATIILTSDTKSVNPSAILLDYLTFIVPYSYYDNETILDYWLTNFASLYTKIVPSTLHFDLFKDFNVSTGFRFSKIEDDIIIIKPHKFVTSFSFNMNTKKSPYIKMIFYITFIPNKNMSMDVCTPYIYDISPLRIIKERILNE